MRQVPSAFALNGVSAYFTMFPLAFPLDVLRRHAGPDDVVLDPFCGRGTTNYAARLLGLPSFGVDSSPVAAALSAAKLANAAPDAICAEAERVLREVPFPTDVPSGEFWEWAYHREVLATVCRLREGLLIDARSDARKALRAVIMGALHGPRPKVKPPSYFSNQCQRTYAPKPEYAVRYWRVRGCRPDAIDVLRVIRARAEKYYGAEESTGRGGILCADSRVKTAIGRVTGAATVTWVISSPPYYGMNTYLPDQWLRRWFLGGPTTVDYGSPGQVDHRSPRSYAAQLRAVWRHAGEVCVAGARLVIRFGGIRDRKADPLALALASLADTGWHVLTVVSAGTALRGKRQAVHLSHPSPRPLEEFDLWAVWRP